MINAQNFNHVSGLSGKCKEHKKEEISMGWKVKLPHSRTHAMAIGYQHANSAGEKSTTYFRMSQRFQNVFHYCWSFIYESCPYLNKTGARSQLFSCILSIKNTTRRNDWNTAPCFFMDVAYNFSGSLSER